MSLNEQIGKGKANLSSLIKNLRNANLSDFKKIWRDFLRRLPDIYHLKNVVFFSFLALLAILALFAQRFSVLYEYLPKKPVSGGTYSEGVVGRIEQLNPLFSPTNSAESSVTSLIFPGLTKKNGDRKNIPDLAERWEVSKDGKEYTFFLRKNNVWEDGQKLTAEDIVFTINTIQDPDSKSALLEVWKGIETVKKDDYTVAFRLPNPYSPFITNTDVSIIPKHILEMVPGRNLKLAEFNLKPVGSGPFKFSEIKALKDSQEVTLVSNDKYWGKKPYLKKVIIKTYPEHKKLLEGYAKRDVLGIEEIKPSGLKEKDKFPNINLFQLGLPRYDAIYFNLRTGATKEKMVREAIHLVTNRSEIISTVYGGEAISLYSPIPPGFIGNNPKLKIGNDPKTAKNKLKEIGYIPDKDGILKKGDARLSLRLVTSDEPELSREADLFQKNLKDIGVEIKLEKYPISALTQDYVRTRNFDLLLISQNLGSDPDIYPFWHSTQAVNPGLNFSGFSDRRLDKALEQARGTTDMKTRSDKYNVATQIIWDETPAIIICAPNYIYGVSNEIKGVKVGKLFDPKDRFWDITNWYLLEERIDQLKI